MFCFRFITVGWMHVISWIRSPHMWKNRAAALPRSKQEQKCEEVDCHMKDSSTCAISWGFHPVVLRTLMQGDEMKMSVLMVQRNNLIWAGLTNDLNHYIFSKPVATLGFYFYSIFFYFLFTTTFTTLLHSSNFTSLDSCMIIPLFTFIWFLQRCHSSICHH